LNEDGNAIHALRKQMSRRCKCARAKHHHKFATFIQSAPFAIPARIMPNQFKGETLAIF
jgi:hypothetical protein